MPPCLTAQYGIAFFDTDLMLQFCLPNSGYAVIIVWSLSRLIVIFCFFSISMSSKMIFNFQTLISKNLLIIHNSGKLAWCWVLRANGWAYICTVGNGKLPGILVVPRSQNHSNSLVVQKQNGSVPMHLFPYKLHINNNSQNHFEKIYNVCLL